MTEVETLLASATWVQEMGVLGWVVRCPPIPGRSEVRTLATDDTWDGPRSKVLDCYRAAEEVRKTAPAWWRQ